MTACTHFVRNSIVQWMCNQWSENVCCEFVSTWSHIKYFFPNQLRFTTSEVMVCLALRLYDVFKYRQNEKTLYVVQSTYYKVSGGPMINTSHLWMSLSSTKPAENPSTGFLFSSKNEKGKNNIKFVFEFSIGAREIVREKKGESVSRHHAICRCRMLEIYVCVSVSVCFNLLRYL